MHIVFMGSGDFALPSFRALIESDHRVSALFTQPDKPAGRGRKLRKPPTKLLAEEYGIEVHQPKKLRAPESVARIEEIAPDCIVVVAYGQILPTTILAIPPKGVINVHGSILPAYRGAAPIQWAIAQGESTTGVTTMLMDEGLDTGPLLLEAEARIDPEETAGSLSSKLAPLGASLLLRTLLDWEGNRLEPRAQDDSKASLAPRIKKEDARIDWSRTAIEIERRVRAFDPWPVAYSEVGSIRLKVWKASVVAREDSGGKPGEVLGLEREGIVVRCGGGSRLLLREVQAEGKRRMAASDWVRGHHLEPGLQIM